MLRTEDILSVLVGHGSWFDTTTGDRRDMQMHRYSKVFEKLSRRLDTIRELEAEHVYSKSPQATATGKQSRNRKTGESLSAAAAQVVAGMPPIHWHSILWVIGSDQAAHAALFSRLLSVGRVQSRRDPYWPDKIRRNNCDCGRQASHDYLPDLVQLALYELRTPSLFSSHAARAEWFGLSPQHWRKIMTQPYGLMQAKAFTWFGAGCGHIEMKLRVQRRDQVPA